MSAPRYMIGASIQDWHQMGLDARENALDAHGGELPPAAIAWAFVLDNPEIFGDCEEWPKDFPQTMPRDFRAAYESGEDCHDFWRDGMKRFSSKHDAICHIRELMGDHAEHEDAELMFNALHDGDLITRNPDDFGWIMEEIGDTEWSQLLREVAA